MAASFQPDLMDQLQQAPDLLPNQILVSQNSAVESEYGAAFVACARIQLCSFDPPFVGSTNTILHCFATLFPMALKIESVRAGFSCRVTNCHVIAGRSATRDAPNA